MLPATVVDTSPAPRLLASLAGPEEAWIRAQLAAPPETLRKVLPTLLPSLARRLGRQGLEGTLDLDGIWADLGVWRRCDAAGCLLLQAAAPLPEETVVDLFLRGDLEEKAILLRAATVGPLSPATSRLLDEVQRTNVVAHLEAACLDSNLLVRALDGALLTRDRFERLVLKVAFNDLPLDRMPGVVDRPAANLSRMLLDLASEREAAGRSIWRDTLRLAAGAPTPGTVARVLGGIEHGDAGLREASADALRRLERPDLAVYARERLERELRPAVRAALERALKPR